MRFAAVRRGRLRRGARGRPRGARTRHANDGRVRRRERIWARPCARSTRKERRREHGPTSSTTAADGRRGLRSILKRRSTPAAASANVSRAARYFCSSGALGAGKTVFVKGLAAGLGLDPAEVTSPSFTLVNRYGEGRLSLYHIDLYRLAEGAAAAHAVDLEELLSDERAVIVIEWAERMGRYRCPRPRLAHPHRRRRRRPAPHPYHTRRGLPRTKESRARCVKLSDEDV